MIGDFIGFIFTLWVRSQLVLIFCKGFFANLDRTKMAIWSERLRVIAGEQVVDHAPSDYAQSQLWRISRSIGEGEQSTAFFVLPLRLCSINITFLSQKEDAEFVIPISDKFEYSVLDTVRNAFIDRDVFLEITGFWHIEKADFIDSLKHNDLITVVGSYVIHYFIIAGLICQFRISAHNRILYMCFVPLPDENFSNYATFKRMSLPFSFRNCHLVQRYHVAMRYNHEYLVVKNRRIDLEVHRNTVV